jgi:hypothetical protein
VFEALQMKFIISMLEFIKLGSEGIQTAQITRTISKFKGKCKTEKLEKYG